mgnify:CR=1 FL=1
MAVKIKTKAKKGIKKKFFEVEGAKEKEVPKVDFDK